MAYTVWKTILKMVHVQEIDVPGGAEFLCAREQREQIAVWYRCNPENANAKEKRRIAIVATGDHCPEGRFLGIASLSGGNLIFHVFEVS